MSNLTNTFTNIADAIRAKTGSSETMTPAEMPTEIANIPSGSTLIEKTINTNGTYNAEDDGADGYSNVTVNVPQPTIEDLTVTANGEYKAPSGKAYGKVTANVPAPSNALFKQTLSNLPSPIATFTGADAPIDSLKASIVGTQDLHGYDKPWPAGGGKNKFNIDGAVITRNHYIDASGNLVENNLYDITDDILINPSTTYSVGGDSDNNAGAITAVEFNENDEMVARNVYLTRINGRYSGTFTSTATTKYIRIQLAKTRETDAKMNTIQLEVGSIPTAFTPYSNVCPISGWTSCVLNRTGKNLCDKKDVTSLSGGVLNLTGNGTFGYVKANNTYTFSFDVLESNSNNVQLRLNNGSVFLRNWTSGGLVANTRVKYTFTATKDGLLNFWANSGAFTPNTKVFDNIQLEIGEETAYEPYNGNTYTIPFRDSSDNPIEVYDGSVDISGGGDDANKIKLTITSGIQLYGTFGTDNALLFYYDLNINIGTYSRVTHPVENRLISNFYNAITVENENDMPDFEIRTQNNAQMVSNRIYIRDSRFESALAFNQYIANNPLEVVVKLATPSTSSFTPPALRSDGVTNISVDCGEVTECKYFSETILYNANNLQIANTSTYITANLNIALEVGKTYVGIIKDYGNWSNVPIIFTRFSGNQSITVSLAQGSGTLVFTDNTVTLDPYAGDYRNIYLTLREYIV